MRHYQYLVTAALLVVVGCNALDQNGAANEHAAENSATPLDPVTVMARAYGFADAQPPAGQAAVKNDVMQAQVVLDRLGFSPKVIDGKEGASFALSLRGFQMSRDLPVTGKLDAATKGALGRWSDVPATRFVRIPEGFAKAQFIPELATDPAAQAKLPNLAYRDILEMLAERFHTTPATLAALNPRRDSGQRDGVIQVPNVGEADLTDAPDNTQWRETLMTLGVSARQPQAAKVVVDKSDGVLRAYDSNDKLIAQFPATMGSQRDPLPLGEWTIKGVGRNPEFHYNPRLFWDVSDSKDAVKLPPGPNSPVGVVWIDLSKPHYGIHGTPEPENIGRTQSHGCIRLTNWDAARLAQMVGTGVKALFQS